MAQTYPDRDRTDDEQLWLEDIYGEKPLAWIAEQNARTLADFDVEALTASAARVLEAYDSDERIPMVEKHGNYLYNHWRDAEHPRGLWRRTTLESYRTHNPDWDVVLDIDALGEDEGKEWVFSGYELLHPNHDRALLSLSPDGGDAVVIREFDMERKAFVEGGFEVPWAKSSCSWIDADTIFVASDFGEETMTMSGYPREVRRWTRGTDLDSAPTVHAIDRDHMIIRAVHDATEGFERDIIVDTIEFFKRTYYLLVNDELAELEIPKDATMSLHREWLTVQPKSDWDVDGITYPTGSLLAIKLDDFLQGDRAFTVVFEPTDTTALVGASWTRDCLILNLIRDVSSAIVVATPADGQWKLRELDAPADELKSMPALFEADDLEVTQHFVQSADGTRIPYFQIAARNLKLDGSHLTVLHGYGGFESSRQPGYEPGIGRAWLEQGGVYVVANIRGGGEYGPAWHTSALRENRHRAYEDFAAVAKDLADRGVTSPKHLGCIGRSNGGLLVGNMLTHYPELFGAIVCGVPLLDMKRYSHLNSGASWIAEYGDPDVPEDWAFIQTFSPYHNLQEGVDYPPVLFWTATSDDRVGPVQARKMAARMLDRGYPNVWFYENTKGGHGGSVDNAEKARIDAMNMLFFRKHLS